MDDALHLRLHHSGDRGHDARSERADETNHDRPGAIFASSSGQEQDPANAQEHQDSDGQRGSFDAAQCPNADLRENHVPVDVAQQPERLKQGEQKEGGPEGLYVPFIPEG